MSTSQKKLEDKLDKVLEIANTSGLSEITARLKKLAVIAHHVENARKLMYFVSLCAADDGNSTTTTTYAYKMFEFGGVFVELVSDLTRQCEYDHLVGPVLPLKITGKVDNHFVYQQLTPLVSLYEEECKRVVACFDKCDIMVPPVLSITCLDHVDLRNKDPLVVIDLSSLAPLIDPDGLFQGSIEEWSSHEHSLRTAITDMDIRAQTATATNMSGVCATLGEYITERCKHEAKFTKAWGPDVPYEYNLVVARYVVGQNSGSNERKARAKEVLRHVGSNDVENHLPKVFHRYIRYITDGVARGSLASPPACRKERKTSDVPSVVGKDSVDSNGSRMSPRDLGGDNKTDVTTDVKDVNPVGVAKVTHSDKDTSTDDVEVVGVRITGDKRTLSPTSEITQGKIKKLQTACEKGVITKDDCEAFIIKLLCEND